MYVCACVFVCLCFWCGGGLWRLHGYKSLGVCPFLFQHCVHLDERKEWPKKMDEHFISLWDESTQMTDEMTTVE